ncbi:MAG: lactate racemase domain-containing protein [Pseudomonadota bacterium]
MPFLHEKEHTIVRVFDSQTEPVRSVRENDSVYSSSMADPIGAKRLSSRDLADTKILIIVDDHSGPTPVADFLPAILGELRSGGATILPSSAILLCYRTT